MPLTVRPATPADVPILVEYNCRLARETEHTELNPATVAAGIRAALADPERKGPYYLACDGDDVVGQLQITFEWSDWRNGWFWWIQSVYVRADARGKGVYRALYEHVRERVRATDDVLGIRLYVECDNQAARATYLRLGMETLHYDIMQELLRPLG
jgi:GNAT superfamily N-acetyltransferase